MMDSCENCDGEFPEDELRLTEDEVLLCRECFEACSCIFASDYEPGMEIGEA